MSPRGTALVHAGQRSTASPRNVLLVPTLARGPAGAVFRVRRGRWVHGGPRRTHRMPRRAAPRAEVRLADAEADALLKDVVESQDEVARMMAEQRATVNELDGLKVSLAQELADLQEEAWKLQMYAELESLKRCAVHWVEIMCVCHRAKGVVMHLSHGVVHRQLATLNNLESDLDAAEAVLDAAGDGEGALQGCGQGASHQHRVLWQQGSLHQRLPDSHLLDDTPAACQVHEKESRSVRMAKATLEGRVQLVAPTPKLRWTTPC